jgi:signal transduction histidine kinase
MTPRRLRPVAIAGLVVGVAAEAGSVGDIGIDRAAADALAGWTLLGSAIVALGRGRNRVGVVLLATGAAWFAGSFWDGALYLHRAGVVLLVAGAPAMRRPRVAAWPVLVLGFLVAVKPVATSAPVLVAVVVAALVLAADRVAAGSERPLVAGCVLCAAAMAIAAVATRATAFSAAGDALVLGYETAVAGVALAALRCLPAKPVGSSAVADLVVELGGPVRPPAVRDALAQALGDPSLLVAYRVGRGERYIDEQGRPVSVPAAGSGRVVTHVGGEAAHVAVLAYDPGAIDDPRLADAVAMAARLALMNARLRAQVAAQVDDLRASRRRLLQAADEERARLEQRLHDGAERRLDEVARMLDRARDGARTAGDATGAGLLDAAQQELDRARSDVRSLARGLHPRTLTEHGLRAAVAELAGASPVAVEVAIPAGRFPEPVEATAYFVCAEALANVVKYARASRVTCAATPSDGVLRVIVEDDGVGGTDMMSGTGLRGLADRLSALGGALRVVSPRHGGTIVAAEIPVGGKT